MKKALAILTLISLTACSNGQNTDEKKKLEVTATFYPLAYLSQEIGGKMVNVKQITPGGVEPHDYEPTPQDLAAIQNSKVFVMNGYGIDAWADSLIVDLQNKGVTVVNASGKINIIASDPHAWLNPNDFKKEAEIIRDALIQADPTNASIYKLNSTGLLSDLVALDKEYRDGLADCKLRKIVTSHDAFRYIARQYGFESLAIAGLSPEEEPSPKRIAELADFARNTSIKYIFFETLVSPKLADTLAKEVGAKSLVLNPIEGLTDEELGRSEDYLILMQQNLKNLRTAMQCK